MISRPLPFFSSGLRLDADLHLPDDGGAGAPYPVVIPASGYQGLKVIHPERFARALTPRGYAVLAFDYRGFGLSEGERGRLVPQEWAEDVRAAVGRVSTVDELDADRISLLGWGMGGGVVAAEAAEDLRVGAVAAVNCIADGTRSTRNMHDEQSWNSLLERVAADRGRRAEIGRSEITSPWDIVRLDLDGRTDGYVGEELYRAPGFGSGVTLESAEMLLRFSPESLVHRVAPRPLLVVHGGQNELHKPEEARSLYEHAEEPKNLKIIDGAGHTEWMFDDHPTFRDLVEELDAFFSNAFDRAPVS
ncbi:alpha/beta hydrolase [Saccharopolyspora karakumensis]|uniref:Alpha/beta hydrolase n=1 Tax=Saccharopolyspora karakumensis TaxID=2530386 RepID=A0A4R5BCJ8_9PSEU|nr:alpha/beta hydrolase [Saccharopolyspora karakumensis]TDD81494.1 alpha/beta hydrolase [Saccharopolyspora karakumensis]